MNDAEVFSQYMPLVDFLKNLCEIAFLPNHYKKTIRSSLPHRPRTILHLSWDLISRE